MILFVLIQTTQLLVYGWMLFAFLQYRRGRQDELLHVLSTAVEAEAPLAAALWTYLEDRPRGWLREFWVATLLFFVLPGYYWIWHRRHSYDQKVARVARSHPSRSRARQSRARPACSRRRDYDHWLRNRTCWSSAPGRFA